MMTRRLLLAAHRLVVTAVVGTCAAAGLWATPTAASAATSSSASVRLVAAHAYPDVSSRVYERRVRHWVNRQRTHRHLPKLRYASCTDSVAERWGRYLARNDAFRHQSMTRVLRRCHARWAGETLGRGSVTPRRLVRMWMRSTPHRRILLSRKPGRIGIGSYRTAHGGWVTAADFMRF